jgi:hypothetical protein
MRYPPYLVLLGCYSLKSFGVFQSSTTYAPEARIPLPQRTGVKSEISSSLQMGSLRQPSLAALAQSSRRAKVLRAFVNWWLVRCSGGLFDPQIKEVFLSLRQQTWTDLRDARSKPTRFFIV